MTKIGLWFIALWRRHYYAFTQRRSRVRRPVVLPAASFADVVIRLAYGSKYKADRRDSLTHPRRIQQRVDEGTVLLGDCDDHAAYWAAVLLRSGLADEMYFGDLQFETRGRRTGHAVAVFCTEGSWYWADYGMPILIPERDAWADSVLGRYGDKLRGATLYRVSLTADEAVRLYDPIIRAGR